MYQLKSGRMDSVAPEIAIEIFMLLQHYYVDACPGQQVAKDYPGGATTSDATCSIDLLDFLGHHSIR